MTLRAGFHGTVGQPSAQVIDGSLKFDSSKKNYLTRTPGSGGNNKTFTFSTWTKGLGNATFFCNGVAGTGNNGLYIMITASSLYVGTWTTSWQWYVDTNRLFRDDGWYHLVVSVDTTQSTASDRVKLYVNGVQETSFATANYPSQNYDTLINNTAAHAIGRQGELDSHYLNKKLSQFYWIDGLQLGPENFGFTDPLTNTWKPKKFSDDFNGYTLTAPTYNSGQGSDVTTSEFDKMVDGDLSTYGQGNGASGTNRFIGFSLAATAHPSINVKIKNTTGSALDFIVQPSVSGSGLVSQGIFASDGNNNGTVNVAANTTLEDTFSFPSGYEGFGRIYLNNSGNAADAWEIYDFGGTKVTTNSFHLPMDGNSPIGEDKSGNGNNWTPVNFGGSVELDKATGARPILNTTQGGTQATVGVFGSRQNVGYAVTVYDDGGGNKYYIDGVKQATLTGLIRGATYTFDTSDSTLGSTHPFRLSATSAHGTEYTNGVLAVTGTATTITIPHDAPESLYYYCTAHSGMGSSITGITTNEKLADQYASHCVLAVPFISGVSDDVSPSIACTSTKKTLTKQGDPTSSTSSNFYSSSTDFDGTGDYYTSGSESDFAFGTGDFTVEFWFDSDGLDGSQDGFLQISDTSGGLKTGYANGFAIYEAASAGSVTLAGLNGTAAGFKSGVWNHIALVREGTSVRLYANGVLKDTQTSSKNISGTYLALGGYYDTNYVYNGRLQDFRIYKGVAKYNDNFVVASTSPAILPDTPSGVSGSSKLTKITEGAVSFDGSGDYLSLINNNDFNISTGDWTIEGFLYAKSPSTTSVFLNKRSNGSTYQWIAVALVSGQFTVYATSNGSSWDIISGTSFGTAVANKWHHWAVVRNGNTFTGYLDGVGKVLTTSSSSISLDTADLHIGSDTDGTSFSGFLSNVRIIKGTALYTSNFTPPFAPLTNVTNTKLLCCQSNISAITAAVSPVTITTTGNAVATNFNPFNTDINTVRGQETGYPTWNPLRVSGQTLSNNNMTATGNSGNVLGSMFTPTSGKFYWEVTAGSDYTMTGIQRENNYDMSYPGNSAGQIAMYLNTGVGSGQLYEGGSITSSWGGGVTGDIIGVALDMDNNKVYFYNNGRGLGAGGFTGTPTAVTVPTGGGYTANCRSGSGAYDGPSTINFGQKPFKFPPPDGFQPLNDANVRPETVIARPDQFVGIVTYTGDANSSRKISGYNFAPDLVWAKQINGTRSNILFDTVRGVQEPIYSDTNDNQVTAATSLLSFNNDGFTVGTDYHLNQSSSYDYVAWCWKAGGSKGTFNIDDVSYASAAAAGLDGGLTVTGASVGTKQGFSIIKATGSNSQNSFKHGLGKVPKFVIAKDMDNTRAWYIYHGSLGANYRGSFDGSAFTSDSEYFGSGMTDTLVTLKSGGSGGNNYNGANMIYYVWADVPGLQKFGTYSGNSSTDGPFIELGFRPALFVMKQTDSTGYWMVYDSARDPINNGSPYYLFWNASSAHGTGYDLDFLSNGVKLRTDNANFNTTSYVYMAWAEAPTVNLFGGGANAR